VLLRLVIALLRLSRWRARLEPPAETLVPGERSRQHQRDIKVELQLELLAPTLRLFF
jgi:hypothetical protein